MGVALFLIGLVAIIVAVVMFILALVRKKGWGIVRSLAIGVAGIVLTSVGFGIGVWKELETPVATTPASSPTQAPQQRTPTVKNLPYEWTENDIIITIHEVFLVDSETAEGWIDEGYQQYKVQISYKNTLHRTNYDVASVGDLKIMTDKGNLYDPKYTGGAMSPFYLDPEDLSETNSYAFNIRKDEKPIELWKFEEGIEQPKIIFKLPN
jgi:hypothetical protein